MQVFYQVQSGTFSLRLQASNSQSTAKYEPLIASEGTWELFDIKKIPCFKESFN